MNTNQNNLFVTKSLIEHSERELRNGHKSTVLWLTGLSGSGKSTLANRVEKELFLRNYQAYVLDGDKLRNGLNSDLDFSSISRTENIRRTGEVARLFFDAGFIVISSFISPFEKDRQMIRELFKSGNFHEVYVECSLEVCESRDPKGLYKKARAGKIADFTGITSPFEIPKSPEITLNTELFSTEQCLETLLKYLEDHQIIPKTKGL